MFANTYSNPAAFKVAVAATYAGSDYTRFVIESFSRSFCFFKCLPADSTQPRNSTDLAYVLSKIGLLRTIAQCQLFHDRMVSYRQLQLDRKNTSNIVEDARFSTEQVYVLISDFLEVLKEMQKYKVSKTVINLMHCSAPLNKNKLTEYWKDVFKTLK